MRSYALRVVVLLSPLMFLNCDCEGVDPIGNLPGALVGNLCDVRTGFPGPGVEMAVTLLNGSSKRASSEAGGAVRMENVEPGTYEVVLSQVVDGRVDERRVTGVVVASSQDTQVSDPACIAGRSRPGTGWVRGRVCNRHTGEWVTAADVTIQLANGDLMVAATNADGTFLIENVPVGDHVLYIRSSSFQRSYAITVIEGRETNLDSGAQCVGVDPNSGGVEGVFCSPNGTGPLTGATAYVDVGSPPVRVSDVTDADGRFIITGLPAGEQILIVELGAYRRAYPVTITAGIVAVVGPSSCFTPDPNTTGRIEGLFCNPGSPGPLVGANVTVDVAGTTLETTTDPLGRFTFAGLMPGSYTVVVQHVSYNQSFPVNVVAGQTVRVEPQGATCPDVVGPVGEIRGRICAPNGTTWLANARVWVDTPQGTVETQTDANGRFVLTNVPPGTYTVNVLAGSFQTQFPNVVVRSNEITEIGDSPDQCVPLEDNHKIAVVTGEWDQVQVVLNRLGINNIDLYSGEDASYVQTLLGDYTLMQTYDVIFFNCGIDDAFLGMAGNPVAVQNTRAFVASGKSIYASDWAYDLVEVAWPDFIDFYGADTDRDGSQVGQEGENLPGSVVDPALRNALSTQNVAINFNLPAWAIMSGASSNSRVYIRGTVERCADLFCSSSETLSNVPLTVGFHPAPNAGKVIYTSFHQERQTTADMDMILQMLVFEL